MKDVLLSALVILVCSALVLLWSQRRDLNRGSEAAVAAATERMGDEPIQAIPSAVALDPRRVALGRRLFHDPLLSGDGSIACASCHPLEQGGADGRPRSIGIRGSVGDINAPSVFNVGLHFRQFWDGRAATLEEQIDGPLHSPKEMGASWEVVLGRLTASADYARAFDEAYPDGVSRDNVKNAIASFERSLLTPNSPFDRYLAGDSEALTERARHGYELFKGYGCIACHQGAAVGGNMFQRLGIVRDYFEDRGDVTRADLGRYNVTGREEDRYVFKVPSLRNVALTGPYFHDGSAATLDEAVRVMGRYQLGREIGGAELAAIVAFLESLTGELRGAS